MDENKINKFKNKILRLNYLSIYSVVIIFSMLSFLSVYYVLHASLKRDIQFTTKEYVTSKKASIKSQVDNLINYINFTSTIERKKQLEKLVEQTSLLLHIIKKHNLEMFKSFLLKKEYSLYNVKLYKNKKLIFYKGFMPPKANAVLKPNEINIIDYQNDKYFIYVKKLKKNEDIYTLLISINQSTINNIVKRKIVEFVNSMQFVFNNGYMSIIEIKNYKGGKKFAKFVAYPKNPDWVGFYLNDNKKDAKGIEYRKEYLKIINTKGSGYFVYWFKKDGKLYKKISYVKLYRPFNWAIFGGIYIDYVNNIINKKKALIEKELRYIFVIYSIISLLFLILIYFITKYENKLLKRIIDDYEREISLKNQELEVVNEQLEQLNQNLQAEVIKKTEELFESYFIDNITGLPNREKFILDIENSENSCIALLNIDSFKEINDFYGMDIGDEVLGKVGEIIGKFVNVYKLSGDEYGVLADNCKEIYKKIKKIITRLEKKHIRINDMEIVLSISAGIGKSIEEADMALKFAKKKKIGKIVIYNDKLEVAKDYREYIKWKNIIKTAIKEDKIYPYVQPIIRAKTGKVDKYEVLLRLEHDGRVYPPFFLEYAKRAGLYVNLQKIMIRKTFKAFSKLDYKFSINLSAMELSNPGFKKFLLNMIDKYNVCDKLTIELLEDEKLMDEELLGFLIYIKEMMGVDIAIDDFGSGHSNISYLIEKIPVTILKLDGSLIKDIEKNENNKKLVKVIVNMAKIFNLTTIAEFVENEHIASILTGYDVCCLQGYYFSKPFDLRELFEKSGQKEE